MPVPPHTKPEYLHYAPGFASVGDPQQTEVTYTVDALAKFLGHVVGFLELLAEGYLSESAIKGQEVCVCRCTLFLSVPRYTSGTPPSKTPSDQSCVNIGRGICIQRLRSELVTTLGHRGSSHFENKVWSEDLFSRIFFFMSMGAIPHLATSFRRLLKKFSPPNVVFSRIFRFMRLKRYFILLPSDSAIC
jgi:hypothetical protein